MAEEITSALQKNGRPISLYSALLARTKDENPEIWISVTDGSKGAFGNYLPQYYEGREGFAIYYPQSGEWEIVPDTVGDSELYVVELYLDSNGQIWGATQWDRRRDQLGVEAVPALSKFDEFSRRFEFADGVLNIPLTESATNYNATQIVIDHQDVFWVLADDGGIYRYNPVTQLTEKLGENPVGPFVSIAVSLDGSIYFTSYNSYIGELRLRGLPLFQFIPETKEVISVAYSESVENWPLFAGLLVDHIGQLWLGAVGYLDLDGEWHLIHRPYLRTYSEHLGQNWWYTPEIIFESSDGKLWFKKYQDSEGIAEGTARYDPVSGEGCLFTTIPANIVEDSNQQLWMVVDGILYRYPLGTR